MRKHCDSYHGVEFSDWWKDTRIKKGILMHICNTITEIVHWFIKSTYLNRKRVGEGEGVIAGIGNLIHCLQWLLAPEGFLSQLL